MATNGKDGMTPSMNFSENIPDRQNPGMSGYLQNRKTKNSFENIFWKENSGYLDTSLRGLKEMEKQYKEIEKIQSKMSESQKKEFLNKKRELEIQLSILNDIKNNQEVSDKEATKAIKEANRIRLSGWEMVSKAIAQISDRQERLKKR